MVDTLKPLTVGELLDRTFLYYRRHFVMFVGIAAVSGLVNLIFQLAVLSTRAGGSTALGALLSLASVVVSLVATTLTHGATVVAVSQILLANEPHVVDAFNSVRHRIGELIIISLNVSVRVVLGFVLLIVPGVWLALRYAVVIPAAVLEETGINDSLSRSATLTQGDFGRIFVVYLLFFVMTAIVGGLLASSAGLLIGFSALLSVTGNVLWRAVALQFAGFAAQALVGPLLPIALVLLYYDERVRKEAFDLEHMLRQLDATGSEAPAR